jgi:PAS domain S-box-containing protein
LAHGQTFRARDLQTLSPHPPAHRWVAMAVACGTPGCLIVPLRCEQTLVGHLLLLGRRVDNTDTDALGLFEDVSSDLSFALTTLHRESLRDQAAERIRLYAAALESTLDGVMVLGRDQAMVSINPALTTLMDYSEQDVSGRTPEFLLSDQANDFKTELRGHLLCHGSWQGEVWFKRGDGEPFMTKLSVSAVRSTNGEASHFVGVFTDITQFKQTEERLARMAQMVRMLQYDPLTELHNRVLLRQRLVHAINLAQRHRSLEGWCSSTSTASRRSTTAWATLRATACCNRCPSASDSALGKETPWAAWAAMISCCCWNTCAIRSGQRT